MRVALRFLTCILCAALAIACDPLDKRFFREGIGTALYTADIAEATNLQDLYVTHICRQAGFPIITNADGLAVCDASLSPQAWALFVQAGMNDIDQRCDAYLAWLDDRKRSAAPILQQIQDMRTATEAIMRVAGVGANPIVIAGTAFGLASATFTNLNSRLLMEVDHSTVQAVVLRKQREYRQGIVRQLIDNRPAAIHALRSYLRLCMPFTIEMEINTTVTLVQRGGAAAVREAERRPLIDAGTVRSTVIRQATVPIAPPPKTERIVSPTRFGPFEERLTEKDIRDFQRAVCVAETGDLGPSGSDTRLAIQRELKATDDTLTPRKGILLRRILRDGVVCPRP